MKKTIRDYSLEGKKVIIRVDLNVPIHDGIITDETRILSCIPTISYAIEKGAKVILMSHLGRIKKQEDLDKNSLEIVVPSLSKNLHVDVHFIKETRGQSLEKTIENMKNGDVVLLQNTRYEDLNENAESGNNEELGAYWASLGEIFINDAFGTIHRSHASNVGIASHLLNGIGFLVEKELKAFAPILKNPEKPFTLILGGSKVSDKIGLIRNLASKCDYILIGGAMAYTFLKAKGISMGKSKIEEEYIPYCIDLLRQYENKIILPIDSRNVSDVNVSSSLVSRFISDTKENEIGVDIGPATVKLFTQYLRDSKTIVWNGPLGMFENIHYSYGTEEMCKLLTHLNSTTVIGGGDTASAVTHFGYEKSMTHISTGGGASLALLEGKKLPGIEIIQSI